MLTRSFTRLGHVSPFANKLGLGFQQVSSKQKDFEDVRNFVWNLLRNKYPVAFPYGTSEVDISDLFVYMFTGKSVGNIIVV